MARPEGAQGARLKRAVLLGGGGAGLLLVALLIDELVRPLRSTERPANAKIAAKPALELPVAAVAPTGAPPAGAPPAPLKKALSDAPRAPLSPYVASLSPYSGNLVVTAPPEELDKRWGAETHNEEWSSNTRTFVEAMLDSSGGKAASVSSVDCKQTICKVSFAGEDMTSVYRMGHRMVKEKVPFQTRVLQGDGGLRFVAYLAREGHEQEIFAR